MGKSLRAHAGDVTGVGSIPGAGHTARSWGAPWTEVGSSPQGCKESDRTEVAEHTCNIYTYMYVYMLVAQSYSTHCEPMGL